MKAVVMQKNGEPDVLQLKDLPEPIIKQPTEVKISLQVAGVNPIDTMVRRNGLLYDPSPPAILGCDGAGIVEAIGKEVSRFKPGDKVWFCHGGLGREQGNYAESNVVDQRWLAKMPSRFSFTEAAASPLVLITAYGALFGRGCLQAGQYVLIHAGAGGVGHVAIQLAKLAGANVLTTVSTTDKAELVQRLGADQVIFYREQNVIDTVLDLTQGKGADLVLDTVGPEVFAQSIEITAQFGHLVTLLDPGLNCNLQEARLRNLSIGFELMLTPMLRDLHQHREQHITVLQKCREWIDQQQLNVIVSNEFKIEQACEAHTLLESGKASGKIVLTRQTN